MACPHVADCGEHVLNCAPDGVVSVKGAIHGYKAPEAQPYCHAQTRDLCTADTDPCCKFSNSSDCLQVSSFVSCIYIYTLTEGCSRVARRYHL